MWSSARCAILTLTGCMSVAAASITAIGSMNAQTTVQQGSGAEADVWQPVRFLLGTWTSVNEGQPGNGTGRREYRLVMNDRFIEIRNTTTYPPQSRNPKGETHEDAGYISYDRNRKTLVLRQFHIEGFVNTYVATRMTPQDIQFTSEAIESIAPGWRARETYRRINDTEWSELFELAEPGGDFAKYAEGRFVRAPR